MRRRFCSWGFYENRLIVTGILMVQGLFVIEGLYANGHFEQAVLWSRPFYEQRVLRERADYNECFHATESFC